MPVRSKAQQAWLAQHRPDLLHKWQAEAPVDLARLPDHVPSKAKKKRAPKPHHVKSRRRHKTRSR